MFTFALPGVLCDLIEFLDRLRLTDEEWAAVDMAAFQYELAMDPDARARARDGAEETVSLPELARAGDPGSDVLLEKIARRDLSIHRNNVTHLPRIAAALPEKHRESFILMFKDRAFPMIHPDLHHAGSMFRELLQEEGLSDGLRLIVSQKFNSYESQYQRTIGAMEERFVEHREIITRTGRMKPAVRAEYDQEMLELHEARVAAAYAAAADLKTLLVAQGATDLVVSVDRFVNFLDNLPQEWRAP